MTEHLRLIAKQLGHLKRMREYLDYSAQRVQRILPITSWQALSLEQHETLAAFRVRFSEFQEHLGKTMRAVAIEEEIEVERFGSVLAFMEKLGLIETSERWKLIRELRNAVNHEYDENPERLTQFSLRHSKLHQNYLSISNDYSTFVPMRIKSNRNDHLLSVVNSNQTIYYPTLPAQAGKRAACGEF